METSRLKKMLFEIACATVACDGKVDEREIRELEYMDQSTTYFGDIDLSKQLALFIENFKMSPENTIANAIGRLKRETLNPVEELLVLEIALRLVYADVKIDPKEIQFVNSIRSCLSLDDETIKQRFGVSDILLDGKKYEKEPADKSVGTFFNNRIEDVENAYFNLGENEKKK